MDRNYQTPVSYIAGFPFFFCYTVLIIECCQFPYCKSPIRFEQMLISFPVGPDTQRDGGERKKVARACMPTQSFLSTFNPRDHHILSPFVKGLFVMVAKQYCFQ